MAQLVVNRYWVSKRTPKTRINDLRRVMKHSSRHNKTYAGKRTKREDRILTIKIRIAVAGIVIIFLSAWMNSIATRSFTFQSIEDDAVTAKAEAATILKQITDGEEIKTSPEESVAVLVETPEQEIRRIAKETNFKWENYLIKLAKCESSLNPQAVNVNKNGSKDRGIFQWNDKTAPMGGISNECAFSIDCSTRATIKAINAGLQARWMCDAILKK